MKYIIANLKAHQNLTEANTWINVFVNKLRNNLDIRAALKSGTLEVILAPSAPFLMLFKTSTHEFPNMKIAAQDISMFEKGSYTGEAGSHALAGLVDYAIVGHSERRSNLNETDEIVRKKVESSMNHAIAPVICVRAPDEAKGYGQEMIAFEPPDAIGSGSNYPVESVIEFKNKLELPQAAPFLYGGSVDETNVHSYLEHDEIAGALVGTACRDASRFCELLAAV